MKIIFFFISAFIFSWSFSQTILVQPYIQDNQTNSIRILWETDSDNESTVYCGEFVPSTIFSGTSYSGGTTGVVHEVLINGLNPNTRYFYKVETGLTQSDTFSFRTLPERSSNPITRIVAISDCQFDSSQPGKLSETVNQGIIDYCSENFGSANIEENIDLTLLIGDNVNTGILISQWRNEFFNNIANLGSKVCLLPVIGNHEGNAANYFTYFNMPQNGTAGFEEHWYYKDVANVRIIGFDSNTAYQNNTQLSWLSNVLYETGSNDDIDFVILMQHHPELSELWLPGETPWAGKVLDSLEAFNLQYSKPALFLFGHTHAYSRGQNKSSKVMQINVATASGYIDLWGSTSQADYTEFNMSFDEYGFMVFETTSGENPEMTIKRITRGDTDVLYNNLLQDSILLRPGTNYAQAPECIFPVEGGEVHPDCIKLHISPFASTGDEVGAVEYLVSENSNFSTTFFSKWKHTENWYLDVNTLADDTLNKQEISGLDEFTMYYWKARYRTKNLDWSEWSEVDSFYTVESVNSGNMIVNQGAEDGINNWTIVTGILESLTAGECAGTNQYAGTYYFGIGGLCTESAYAEAYQDVDVNSYASQIDAGNCFVNAGAYMSDYSTMDIPAFYVSFLDESNSLISSTSSINGNTTSWTLYSETTAIPVDTRIIRFTMTGTRNSGTDNDSYVDNIFLTVSSSEPDCWHYANTSGTNIINDLGLKIYPNPANDFIQFTGLSSKNNSIKITDVFGKIVFESQTFSESARIDISNIKSGFYFIVIETGAKRISTKKLVVK